MGNPALVDPDTVRRTAAEAWIWGFPLIENYRTLYPRAVDDADPRYVGGFGVFGHRARPITPADPDQVAPGGDPEMLCSRAWLDLRAEPWVVEVAGPTGPDFRYRVVSLHDLDTRCIGCIGPAGPGLVGGQGPAAEGAGRRLVGGPGFTGAVPPGFGGILRAGSDLVGVVARTHHLAGPQDLSALRESQAGYRLMPLSAYLGGRPPSSPSEPHWPVWREEAREGLDFFSYLDFLLGFLPVRPAEAELRGRLAELGVGAGDFEPAALPVQLREAMTLGVADGRAEPGRAATTALPADADADADAGTSRAGRSDPSSRVAAVFRDPYALPPGQAWCVDLDVDPGTVGGSGRPLGAGGHDFVLHFGPGELPPVRYLWSVAVHGLPSRLPVANPIDRYAIGDRTPGLVRDSDGGLTLHLRRARPADPAAAANWLPVPDGPFAAVLRLYGPDPAVPAGHWRPPRLTVRP
ncbi:DUF1214 domain-containing protein [Kitasatospora sp. MBT63]|uniref:DUF1214 domain-containing protein n=1 Tax=Kitasatospora sp. MBT63 TaxID=1444768 RepID=UPI00053BA887|nr:DUF1214 domain-containing protein [Kitasatospora sp. MBT63]